MRNTIKNITFFAALALMSVSCVEDKMGGYVNDGVIRYDLDNTAPVVAKSSQEVEELSPIVLTSEDGKYSFTLQRSARPTLLQEAASKAAPVTGMSLKDNYNDGSLQIKAFKGDETYMAQQKLIFASQEAGQTTSLWKTENINYWPESGSLDFWSWAPASESAADGKISGVAFNEDKSELSFTYTSPKSGDNNDAELQKDVILAYDKASDIDRRNVSLMYKHALCALCFQVDRSNKCMVKSVSLGNVYGSATCTFDGTNIVWNDYGDVKEFKETFNKEISEYLKDDYANPQTLSDGTDEKTFLLIPQSATDEKKVTMTLVIRLDGAEKDLTLSVELDPDDAFWEAGWTYTYSLSGVGDNLKVSVTDKVEGKTKSAVEIRNTDQSFVKCFMRAIVVGDWYNSDDEIVARWKVSDGSFDDTFPVTVGQLSSNNWTLGSDGFYYYKYPVHPGKLTGETASDTDGDPLFVTYTAPSTALVLDAKLKIHIVAQGVAWDEAKVHVTDAWGLEAAGYLSASDKE